MKILLVDDEQELLETLRFILELEDFQVESAANGRECLNKLMTARPDVILSDIMMPLMSGLELVRAIKENASWAQIPIILMSAGPEPRETPGWAAFIAKPFEVDGLVQTIRDVTAGASSP